MPRDSGALWRFALTVAGITVGTAVLGNALHGRAEVARDARPGPLDPAPAGDGAPPAMPGMWAWGGEHDDDDDVHEYESKYEDEYEYDDEDDDEDEDEHEDEEGDEHWRAKAAWPDGRRHARPPVRPPAAGRPLPELRSHRS